VPRRFRQRRHPPGTSVASPLRADPRFRGSRIGAVTFATLASTVTVSTVPDRRSPLSRRQSLGYLFPRSPVRWRPLSRRPPCRCPFAGSSASGGMTRRRPGPRRIRLACAAGPVCLPACSGLLRGKRFRFPPGRPRFRVLPGSAPHGPAFAFPERGRCTLRDAEAPRPYHRAVSSRALSHPFGSGRPTTRTGLTLSRPGTAPLLRPFGLRRGGRLSAPLRSGRPPRSGLPSGSAFRPRHPDPSRVSFPAITESAERAVPSALRLGQSCTPLKRIAGEKGVHNLPCAARSKP